jgi:hypothetical protein
MSIAKGLSIYGNGIDLKYAIKEYNPNSEIESLDATALGHTDKVYELGFKNGTISLNGVWKYDEVNLDEIGNLLRTVFQSDTDVVLTVSREVLAIGGQADLSTGFVTKYSKPTQSGQLIMTSAELQTRTGIELGKWLFSGQVDDETINGTSVDNGAATSNGGILHVHAQNSSLADLSDASVTLQHSVDGSTWVDLLTNVQLDGVAENEAIAVAVAAGTTVRRYLRAVPTTSGGIAFIQTAFARR